MALHQSLLCSVTAAVLFAPLAHAGPGTAHHGGFSSGGHHASAGHFHHGYAHATYYRGYGYGHHWGVPYIGYYGYGYSYPYYGFADAGYVGTPYPPPPITVVNNYYAPPAAPVVPPGGPDPALLPPPTENVAYIDINLPADAELFIRAVWKENDREVSTVRHLSVRSGDRQSITFITGSAREDATQAKR